MAIMGMAFAPDASKFPFPLSHASLISKLYEPTVP